MTNWNRSTQKKAGEKDKDRKWDIKIQHTGIKFYKIKQEKSKLIQIQNNDK